MLRIFNPFILNFSTMPFLKKVLNGLFGNHAYGHEPDKKLIIIAGIIIVFGLIMLSSATSAAAYQKYGSSYYFLNHQLFGVFIGLIGFWYFSKNDYHRWRKKALWFLFFSIALLLLVFIPALSAKYGSSRSWINIFGFSLQPSEFVKLSFLLYLSAWLEKRRTKLGELSEGIGPFVFVLGIIAVLMLLQPDLGTLAIITVTSLIVYYVGGGKLKHVLIIILIGFIAMGVMMRLKPYQADRFKCFFNSNIGASAECYQVNQSLIAVGSGGIFGRGFGESRQKYMYIPEVESDFIFSIICEELGLVFSSLLTGLFIFLFYRGCQIAKNAPDNFGRLLAIGISSWIAVQAVVNISGIINLMPMTGVPLPLISYGGSAMLASLSALGVLVNISRQTRLR